MKNRTTPWIILKDFSCTEICTEKTDLFPCTENQAIKWNETEDHQLVRLFHKVIFKLCSNKTDIKIKGTGNYTKNNEIKICLIKSRQTLFKCMKCLLNFSL